ncbi:carboxypeptidase-like regulatory domain-containing protein [Formosa sp. PL04]|uniref:carboxypeptidase-like regulatory domain-containing protein n=1 Tax=Formosa sp. PL04 TaxID=3081755 RepID=UPI00298178B1|nr:carboxypeptidase-like regulatory domain-containing protein [Formosa sp. PL04]MDW5290439.1 carboxypeptidase-like regulatory domain-containing protein [Formosa sp. PL04]
MKKLLLFLFLITTVATLKAQSINRVEISGRIIVVDTDEIEGVTVYNTSSNIGTITDENGEFKIKAALLDVIEISALQFNTIQVKIDLEIINSKQVTVFLVEHINRLNEVVIMPYGLTGVLHKDLDKIQTFTPDMDGLIMGVDDISTYEFAADYHTAADMNILNQGEYYNGMDMVAITNTFLKPLFKKKVSKTDKIIKDTDTNLGLRGIYSHGFLSDNFNIPGPQVDAFINYIDLEMDSKFLDEGQEIELLEYLSKQSSVFLAK